MRILSTLLLLAFLITLQAQEIIKLPHEEVKGVLWDRSEQSFYSEDWDNEVVTNVSEPTMQVFRAKEPNGTAVIIAPGGGLYALSIKSEGTMVAKWLAEKGITAFVLKYRLVPTGDDGVKDLSKDGGTPDLVAKKVGQVLPFSIDDALAAISHVRENAEEYGVDQKKIGLIGFSAGGAVTMGAGYNYSALNRPDFLGPIYAWTKVFDVVDPPSDAPPIFIMCASDDPIDLAPGSVEIYNSWLKAKKPAALHMYAKGGHGFGMKPQGLPSDHWIERFYEWLQGQDLVK